MPMFFRSFRLGVFSALALALGGCSPSAGPGAGPMVASAPTAAARVEGCPPASLREGTGILRRGEGAARLEATVAQVSRSCTLDDGRIAVAVRVTGDVTSAARGAGSIDLPIRVAMVGGDGKVLYSQLETVRVDLAGEGAKPFTHTDASVSLPADAAAGAQIFAGFDELGAGR